MIIDFPTGLYNTVLPQLPSDRGNITFEISNNPPPRTNLLFPKITKGITNRKRPEKTIDIFSRRSTQGDLIFSISSAGRSSEGNNARVYEIGQVLEFSDAPIEVIDPMLVAPKSETRHDTNKFDYEALNISDDEVAVINEQSLLTQEALTQKLNIARENRSNAEVEIRNQQKIINDTTRNINALQVVVDNSEETDPSVDELINKFVEQRDAAFTARDQAKTDANQYAAEASEIQDQLRVIATVVK